MAKIIPIRQSDIKKIVKMIEYISPGLNPGIIGNENFSNFPFNTLHNLLPINLKFLQESYVAVENDEPLGLISLAPDGSNKTRWKINRLILGIDAYDAGKQLVDYVVNKYGGAGVEIFITIIDENSPETIALFQKACCFRNYSKINVWEDDYTHCNKPENDLKLLRKAEPEDAQKIFELDSEAILPHLRTSLVKTAKDFRFDLKNQIKAKLKGYKTNKYVLDNPGNDTIEAFLSISTADNTNFWIDTTLSLAYKEYYENLLDFAIHQIRSENKNAKIYMGIKDYHQTCKFMSEVVSNRNFKLCGNYQVLVKDYWKPAEYYKEKKVPSMIFPEMTSPACNIIRFIREF